MADPKERALWLWAQVENLDQFLERVYVYYDNKGFWSITFGRILNLVYEFLPRVKAEIC